MPRAGLAQCGRRRGDRRAARVDVVDEHRACRRCSNGGGKRRQRSGAAPRGRGHVAPSSLDADSGSDTGRLPALAQLGRQASRGAVTPADAAIGIGRHRHERIAGRLPDCLDDQLGGDRGHAALAALLPGTHECPHRRVVDHRGACARERETPPRALAAAPHGPGRRRAAAFAERRRQPRQRPPAPCAELVARLTADEAPARQQEVEQLHASTLCLLASRLCAETVTPSRLRGCQPLSEYSARGGSPARSRMRLSASSSWPRSPMSSHAPAKR